MSSGNFTGERPGWGDDFDYDEARHLAAYLYAATLVQNRRALDAGCGEGFGTQTLIEAACEVVGVDYSESAIEFCTKRWSADGLKFEHVDLTNPGDFTDRFDVVLNFQVLEHIKVERPFLEALRERLDSGGQLMLTTPNRLRSFSENPYHVREYTADELQSLLGEVFSEVRLLGMHGNDKVEEFDAARERAVKRILRLDPFGLRNMLPDVLVKFAFAKLAVLVRREARGDAQDKTQIVPGDFFVSEENIDNALDLVALCRT